MQRTELRVVSLLTKVWGHLGFGTGWAVVCGVSVWLLQIVTVDWRETVRIRMNCCAQSGGLNGIRHRQVTLVRTPSTNRA